MKIILAILFFFGSLFFFGFIAVGMHGHLMFRPWMAEDWVFWGLVLMCFIVSVGFTISAIRDHRKH